jgi:putative nucleotidyltransferase with HDIG domain
MVDEAGNGVKLQTFIVTVFLVGAAAFTTAMILEPVSDPLGLATIVALVVITERLSVRLYFDGRLSISFMGAVLAALWFGTAGTAFVSAAIAISGYFFSDRSMRKLLFNFGQHNIAGLAASVTATVIGIHDHMDDPVAAIGVGALLGTIIFLVTTIAVSSVMSMSTGRSLFTTHRETFAWLFPHYLALGVVAGGLAIVYNTVGIAGLLALSLPLALSRYAMKQVIDKTRDNVLRLESSNQELRHMHLEITEMSDKIKDAYDGTLESLVAALDLRDQETRGHSVRVATHSLEIAKMLGIQDEEELAMMRRGALMHDVGKIGVPDAILRKPGKLTEEEWVFMRKHSSMGYKILAQVAYLRPAAKIVLAHHERWDGDGYPRRLKAGNIPLGSRIFAVCDTYDAIISDRPYRDGQPPDAAFAEILRCAGTQFDPKVVEAFESVFPRWREESPTAAHALYLPTWKGDRDAARRAAS